MRGVQKAPLIEVPYSAQIFGQSWTFQTQVLLNTTAAAVAFWATGLFWRTTKQAYREQVDSFFETMLTPVDFQREVGVGNDDVQLRLLGRFGLAGTVFVLLLLFLPNSWPERAAIFAVAAFIGVVSGLMLRVGLRNQKRLAKPSSANRNLL